MDVGTAYEMGAGSAFEKVSKAHTVRRAEDGHVRDERNMSVEEFGVREGGGLVDNLMISCGMEKLCNSEEEGIAFIAAFLKGKSKA